MVVTTGERGVTGIWGGDATDAVRTLYCTGQSPTSKNYAAQVVNSADAENSCCRRKRTAQMPSKRGADLNSSIIALQNGRQKLEGRSRNCVKQHIKITQKSTSGEQSPPQELGDHGGFPSESR